MITQTRFGLDSFGLVDCSGSRDHFLSSHLIRGLLCLHFDGCLPFEIFKLVLYSGFIFILIDCLYF